MIPKVLYSFYYQNFDRNYFVTLDDQVFVNLPNFGVGKIFNPQNMLYIHPVKNCFRLEFEQIP
jgi:hypothetical protein